MAARVKMTKTPRVSKPGRAIIVDTGFWFALYTPSDQNHQAATTREDLLESSNVLIPWPSLYETFNSKFAKNALAVQQFQRLLRRGSTELLGDEPYREFALQTAIAGAVARGLSLVDVVIRLILDDVNVRKNGLLTFDPGDFADVYRRRRVEML
jgi:predicted nucleic acid-binding protein